MYDELYEAWKKEKEFADIQPLPRDFYAKLADYVKRLREERRMLDERTLRGGLIQKEEENARRLIEELVKTRYEKAMRLVMDGEIVSTSSLTDEEARLYEGVYPQTEAHHSFLKDLLLGRLPEVKKREAKPKGMTVIRILKEIPPIIGADMKTYGPFKPEDIATLPDENAKILIKQGAAMEIETQ